MLDTPPIQPTHACKKRTERAEISKKAFIAKFHPITAITAAKRARHAARRDMYVIRISTTDNPARICRARARVTYRRAAPNIARARGGARANARSHLAMRPGSAASSLYDDALDAAPRVERAGHPVRYGFAQAFGERGAHARPPIIPNEADVISSVQFSNTTDMVATGDRGGRIVILRRARPGRAGRRAGRLGDPNAPQFRFWTQFQSHEPEFDYLKSMEIEERINQIRWCRQSGGAQRIITTNDKTVKVWRVYEKDVKAVANISPSAVPRVASESSEGPSSPYSVRRARADPGIETGILDRPSLRVPRMVRRGTITTASPRRVFSKSHVYHINSLSLNSDEETFLSADDLRINLWNLDAGGRGFTLLDMKPDNMEDLTEVVTCAQFHPRHCHTIMHSSSRGAVKICDMRQTARCGGWEKKFQANDDQYSRASFFSEIIASISDVKFSPDGRYILTRDYMNLRLWDVNMERAPLLVLPVHERLRLRLCDLYENDCIFDKFQCCFSHDGGSLLTGSYNSLFQTYSASSGVGAAIEASVDFVSGMSGRHLYDAKALATSLISHSTASELVDPNRRIMHLDASPTESIAAVAAGPALYIYYGAQKRMLIP